MARPALPMIGKRFGRLVVETKAHRHETSNHLMYYCKCDCGNTKLISGNKLRTGNTKSCGCLRTPAGKKAFYGA